MLFPGFSSFSTRKFPTKYRTSLQMIPVSIAMTLSLTGMNDLFNFKSEVVLNPSEKIEHKSGHQSPDPSQGNTNIHIYIYPHHSGDLNSTGDAQK